MKEVRITIDGREIIAKEGESLLWTALDNGIYIPHLCAIREAERPAASCRLCFVEVEGLAHPVTSCTTPVSEGMVVKTRSPRVDRLVQTGFELLLSNHRLRCGKCSRNKKCELQKIARERGLKLRLTRLRKLCDENTPVDESLEGVSYDPAKCVLCGRCVWVDHHLDGGGAIGFIRRGFHRKVAAFNDLPLGRAPRSLNPECARVCPVGALTVKEDE